MAYSCVYPEGYTLTAEEQARYPEGKRFTTLVAWAAQNLSLTEDEICEIIGGDEEFNWSGTVESSQISLVNWRCNTKTLTIRAIGLARHKGIWSDTAHRIVGNADYQFFNSTVTESIATRITLDGLQIASTSATIGNVLRLAATNSPASTITVKNCIIYARATTGGKYLTYFSGPLYVIKNNLFLQDGPQSAPMVVIHGTDTRACIYNNVFRRNTSGQVVDTNTKKKAVGNVFITLDKNYIIGVYGSYNAASTATATSPITPENGSWDNEFENYSANNFTLKPTGNLALAVPVSAYDPLYIPETDIAGNPRQISEGGFLSVGAFDVDIPQTQTFSADSAWDVMNSHVRSSSAHILNKENTTAAWHIKNMLAQNASWNILSAEAGVYQIASWHILAEKRQPSSAHILNKTDTAASWRLMERISRASAWHILGEMGHPLAWHIRNLLSQDSSWGILNLSAMYQDVSWHILNRFGRAASWQIDATGKKAPPPRPIKVFRLRNPNIYYLRRK